MSSLCGLIKKIYRLNYASNLKVLGGPSFFVNLGRDGQYAEDLSYDKNGNITTLKRYGQEELGQPIEIDDLTYTYTANQLQTVTDATNNAEGFKDGNKTGNDYVYDSFGNITQDKNKKITNVKYNHLNLPTEVVFNTGKINYIYDAAGTRLSKKIQPSGGALVTTDYVNGFQYENNVLQFFPHPEGYVKRNTNNTYLYAYQYKDHLGNVRLSYADVNKNGTIEPASEILEENNYYPFGLKHKGYNNIANSNRSEGAERYKFNGMEWQPELGLDLYDFGARNYDAAIGRWLNIDPLAEVSRRWTPYNYAYNNPIYFVDPDGMLSGSFNNGYFKVDIEQFGGSMESWAGGFWTEESSGVEHDPPGSRNDRPFGEPDYNQQPNKQDNITEQKITPEGPVLDDISGQSFLGKAWSRMLDGRKWTDPETGITYLVNDNGIVSGIAPVEFGGGGLDLIGGRGFMKGAKNLAKLNKSKEAAKTVKTAIPKGFKETKEFGKSHGQKVYKKGERYISRDVGQKDGSSHNGGVWKEFKKVGNKLVRTGTLDGNLKRIKD